MNLPAFPPGSRTTSPSSVNTHYQVACFTHDKGGRYTNVHEGGRKADNNVLITKRMVWEFMTQGPFVEITYVQCPAQYLSHSRQSRFLPFPIKFPPVP